MLDKVLERGYWIATWIVCLIAMGGLCLSIQSSRETATILERIAYGMKSLTAPLLKFKDYNWATSDQNRTISFWQTIGYIGLLQTKLSHRERHEARRIGVDVVGEMW